MIAGSHSLQVHLSASAAATPFQPGHAADLPQSPPATLIAACKVRPPRTIGHGKYKSKYQILENKSYEN